MLVILIMFKFRFQTHISHSDFTDTTVKCILEYFTTTIFLFHLHYYRIININTVTFYFYNFTFERKVIFPCSPLAGSLAFNDLIHLNIMYPILCSRTINNDTITHFKICSRRNLESVCSHWYKSIHNLHPCSGYFLHSTITRYFYQ